MARAVTFAVGLASIAVLAGLVVFNVKPLDQVVLSLRQPLLGRFSQGLGRLHILLHTLCNPPTPPGAEAMTQQHPSPTLRTTTRSLDLDTY